MDSGTPANIITAESLGSQADYLEQAETAFERAFHTFTAVLRQEHPLTAALRYPERKNEANMVHFPNPRS